MENSYTITYSNHFKIGNRTFAFRKGELFDVTRFPFHINIYHTNKSHGCTIAGTWYGKDKLKEMAKDMLPLTVDVSVLQWWVQEELNHVFNLFKHSFKNQ